MTEPRPFLVAGFPGLFGFLFPTLFLLTFATARAEPVVIDTVGATTSMAEYYLMTQTRLAKTPRRAQKQAGRFNARTFILSRFPIHTPEMSPGPVRRRTIKHQAGLPQPICLVGVDQRSIQWIQRNRNALLKNKAVCLVIEAPTLGAYRALEKILGAIPHYAATASDIARLHHLEHYPMLISRKGIEQ